MRGLVWMELFLINYGLLAVFLAAAVEADVVPILTGALVRLGYLKVTPALLCVAIGAFSGDCVWFWAGRNYSTQVQASSIYRRMGAKVERLTAWLSVWQIPASHVIYGTRVATMVLWPKEDLGL